MATFRKQGGKWRAEICRLGVRRSRSFVRKLEAQAWAVAEEKAIEHGRMLVEIERISLADVMARYAKEVSPTKRGVRWERIRLESLARDELAERDIHTITPEMLGKWRDRRLQTVSAGTVLREITLLVSVFEHARREWGLIESNPWRDVRKPSQPAHRKRLISDAEVERITLALGYDDAAPVSTKSQQIAVMLLLALETAMRSGELCSLTWDRVDLHRRVVSLERTKNGDVRQVPLSVRAVDLLRKLQGIDPVRCFIVEPGTRDALFRRAREDAGCHDLTFHDSRATALTRLSKKLDVLQLARVAGHRDLKSLMAYYRESAEDIAKML